MVVLRRRLLRASVLRWSATLLGLCLAAILLVDGTYATTSDQTANGPNSIAAGTVVVTDDDGATRMFNLAGMNPGQQVMRCINVSYGGTLTAGIRLYAAVAGTGLAPGLTATVEVGTGAAGGTGANCTGFAATSVLYTGTLTALGTNHAGYATGLQGFNGATNGTSRSYRFTVLVSDDDSYLDKNATATFTWEARGP